MCASTGNPPLLPRPGPAPPDLSIYIYAPPRAGIGAVIMVLIPER